MDKNEIRRAKAILAMEYLARQMNNEDIFERWLMGGVADGDIPYGSFDIENVDSYYIKPENFKDIACCFMRMMITSYGNGGLYCGSVVADKESD